MQMTFVADTRAQLEQQMREFLGLTAAPAAASPAAAPAPSGGLPVPEWAPPGSRWLKLPGAPVLVGPDSTTIPVAWVGSTPTPGTLVHRRDEKAETAGAALRKSITGQ